MSVPPTQRTARGLAFPQTSWSLVFETRRGDRDAGAALEELCRRYWPPIFTYLRRRGLSPPDAEDATQQFFLEVLQDETLQSARPEDGRLRTFLLSALQRSLADQTRWRTAAKRGGGVPPVSLDLTAAEELNLVESVDHRDPEQIFLAAWAQSLLQQARRRLRESYGARAELYTQLEPFLDPDEKGGSYREAAARLGIPEVTARVHVSRLRKRFADFLRAEVRETVSSPDEVESELDWLFRILRGA